MTEAAVLLLILQNKHILFIKRNRKLKYHAGEISFPGGKYDSSLDNNLIDTATRETFEEIGITDNNYKIIDRLSPEKTVSTNFSVHTFIAKAKTANLTFDLNIKEVESIITVPIEHFHDSKFKVKVPLKINNKKFFNTFYYYKNILIWGATSRILDNFLEFYKNDGY